MSALDTYAASFLDPFDGRINQPKILDGSVTRSSGLKFRSTGNITLEAAGADNFIVLFPGFSNCLAWKIGAASYSTHLPFPTHLGTTTDRGNLNRVRLVSSGLKLSLLNSSDDNEGYWEAVRVPYEEFKSQWALTDAAAPVGEDMVVTPNSTWTYGNMANSPTFQTGRLRDIHRFLFKINSVAPDHTFSSVPITSATPTVTNCIDPFFDVIVIRIVGRIDAVTPSMLQYDVVSNQEIVYRESTVMHRLSTLNTMVPNIDVLLDRTRFILPAIQIA